MPTVTLNSGTRSTSSARLSPASRSSATSPGGSPTTLSTSLAMDTVEVLIGCVVDDPSTSAIPFPGRDRRRAAGPLASLLDYGESVLDAFCEAHDPSVDDLKAIQAAAIQAIGEAGAGSKTPDPGPWASGGAG